ncbi:MAG: GIY-YIG nuclease family protein [Flavobacteriales bacterium]|nr:GIY-YIG nuclease family protein [Flavobacteriales bacterium]
MDEFVVYVLYSESGDRLYIGYSSVSIERFYWHNERSSKGFTLKYRPWKMIHIEFFDSKSGAMEREKQLKGGQGRNWLRTVVLPSLVDAGFISA